MIRRSYLYRPGYGLRYRPVRLSGASDPLAVQVRVALTPGLHPTATNYRHLSTVALSLSHHASAPHVTPGAVSPSPLKARPRFLS